MDAIKTIFEIMVAKNILSADKIGEMLARQSKGYPPEAMPRAVFVSDWLRETVTDPARKELREQFRRILEEPPAGSA